MKSKQILAIIGIVLLVSMYVITLVLAFVDKSAMSSWFMASLFCTAVVPILLWLVIRFLEWKKKDGE